MTRRDLLDAATAALREAGVDEARRTAEWVVEHATGLDRVALIARPGVEVPEAERALVDRLVARRAAGEPVQYVIGQADFRALTLRVTRAVLVPRPETEEVVDAALAAVAGVAAPWVLDVGTGSGAIALAIKHERPDAVVFAVDVSEAALGIAAGNAERLGLDVSFARADVLAPGFAGVPSVFDLVVSNPPYVPDAERATLQAEVRREPELALFVPDGDPLRFYRALAGHAPALLKPGGHLVVETHADHGDAVVALFRDLGLDDAEVRQDLAGRDRIAVARRP